MERKQKTLRILIIILAILFGISSVAWAGTLVYKKLAPVGPASVVVPDNIITPEADTDEDENEDKGTVIIPLVPDEGSDKAEEEKDNSSDKPNGSDKESKPGSQTADPTPTSTPAPTSAPVPAPTPTQNNTNKTAAAVYLHRSNSGYNEVFKAGNMFPGDAETKYFCIQVSYNGSITVKYHADIRSGYEKLAEVFKCKIVLLNSGETLYDGLMRDMPKSLNHKLTTSSDKTTELYYEITTYLDTSVGNEYQNTELIADFNWWVEESSNLIVPPKTGDDSKLALWVGLMFGSLLGLVLLFATRKKEGRHEHCR